MVYPVPGNVSEHILSLLPLPPTHDVSLLTRISNQSREVST